MPITPAKPSTFKELKSLPRIKILEAGGAAAEAPDAFDPPGRGPSKAGTFICSRPLMLPGDIPIPGFRHVWIQTRDEMGDTRVEAGLGPSSGQIPTTGLPDLPGTPVSWISHQDASKLKEARCVALKDSLLACWVGVNVSQQRVEEEIKARLGQSEGRYLWPPSNNCVTAAVSLLQNCRNK